MLSARFQSPQLWVKKSSSPRSLTIVKAKERMQQSGYVQEDNSGKGNIFPTQQRAFYSSPTTEAAAQQGLGGATGGAVLAGAIGVVGLATAAVLKTGSGETLNQVQDVDLESLGAIAERIAASL